MERNQFPFQVRPILVLFHPLNSPPLPPPPPITLLLRALEVMTKMHQDLNKADLSKDLTEIGDRINLAASRPSSPVGKSATSSPNKRDADESGARSDAESVNSAVLEKKGGLFKPKK